MSYHGKLQTLKNGTADAEIQLWAYQQLEKEPAELTDEEIEDIRSNEWLSFAVKQKSNGIKPSTGAAWEHWLAKAILRKAQEK